jgi:hypothetical protein
MKSVYEIRGNAVKANLEDHLLIDHYAELTDSIANVNAQNKDFPNATSRQQIVDKEGLKFLVPDPYKNCQCPLKCPACFQSKFFVDLYKKELYQILLLINPLKQILADHYKN